ncbi:hypothetical protein BOX15_Mlig015969g3 [Macrostomum lignano]|uniref:AcidPPc domain-containing protein n=2 Tax=Macrostomum lignano TaxID=282301 RepID=A0A1I8HNW4_9PLAT|nr:hypothetical protein BOX15_Mlig015969g3 [Macrostomum lignano]
MSPRCYRNANSRHRLVLTVISRICFLLSICLIFGALHLFVAPFPRRFFCTDQSLRYLIPPGSTVPYAVCAPLGVALATILIFWFEVLRGPNSNDINNNINGDNTASAQNYRHQRRRHRWSNCMIWLYYFCLGCSATELLTVSAKLALGRHRPYFLEACKPDPDILGDLCNSSVPYPVSICRPTMSKWEFKDAQMSFPSGHTSYSLFVVVFLAGYLHMKLGGCPAARFGTQLFLILIGLCVGYSRVSDYKHHWSDVLGGVALGAGVAAAALHSAMSALTAAAAQSLSVSGCNGDAAAGSAEIDEEQLDVECSGEVDDDLVVSGPPRRIRLRDQAVIDAEDQADRDNGNVDDEARMVARNATSLVVTKQQVDRSNGNGLV